MRLSPVDPEKGIALSGIGMSYLMLERFEEALQWGENALREMPNYGSSHRVVIGALVGLGRLEEAQEAARRLMEAFPTYNPHAAETDKPVAGRRVRRPLPRCASHRRHPGVTQAPESGNGSTASPP